MRRGTEPAARGASGCAPYPQKVGDWSQKKGKYALSPNARRPAGVTDDWEHRGSGGPAGITERVRWRMAQTACLTGPDRFGIDADVKPQIPLKQRRHAAMRFYSYLKAPLPRPSHQQPVCRPRLEQL